MVTDAERLIGNANVIPGRVKGGAHAPSVRLWPNGEFTLGYAPAGALEEEHTWSRWFQQLGMGLDLAMPINSHSDLEEVTPRRGQRGLTSRGARMVRNCADAMEKFVGKENLTFCTLTLPDLSFEDFWDVSSSWAEIVRRLYQKLGRHLKKHKLSAAYVGVTELQPKRTARDGVPALHLHFIFQGRKRGGKAWVVKPQEMRAWWKDVVEGYTTGRYDFQHAENLQQVRETAAGYLSKYMSKGSDITSPILSNERGWSLPTAWYNCSMKLKAWVVNNTYVSPEMASLVESEWRGGSFDNACHYYYEGTIEECPGPGPHFCIGMFTQEAFMGLKDAYYVLWASLKPEGGLTWLESAV